MTTKIDLIIDPENEEAINQMQDICEFFMEQGKPHQFNPRATDNILVKNEKSFENILASMQEAGIKTEQLTVFEFYSRIEYFEDKYAKVKRHGSNKQV